MQQQTAFSSANAHANASAAPHALARWGPPGISHGITDATDDAHSNSSAGGDISNLSMLPYGDPLGAEDAAEADHDARANTSGYQPRQAVQGPPRCRQLLQVALANGCNARTLTPAMLLHNFACRVGASGCSC